MTVVVPQSSNTSEPEKSPPEDFPCQAEAHLVIEDGHYSIESNSYFKVMGYDHGSYFIYTWIPAKVHEYTDRSFTVRNFIKLAPLAFWKANFPSRRRQRGAFNRLAAMSAMMRLANSLGLVT